MKRLTAAAAAAALLLAGSTARAQCKLTAVDVPVTMDGLRPMVEANIAGEPVKLLLDTGAPFSAVSAGVAKRLKLKVAATNETGTIIPQTEGIYTRNAARERHLAPFVVAPILEFGGREYSQAQLLAIDDPKFTDGILGRNLLHAADEEFDFSKGVFRLVKPAGCETSNLAHWVNPGQTYSVIPLAPTYGANTAPIGAIEVNGISMRAFFNTGARTSLISERAAARAGVKTSDPGVEPAEGSQDADADPVRRWVGRFASIKIGSEEVRNSRLTIVEIPVTDLDVILGADFFLAHHVYIANSQGKIYFSYEGGPVFRAAPPNASSGAKAP